MTDTPEPLARRHRQTLIIGAIVVAAIFATILLLPIPASSIMAWGSGVAYNPYAVTGILILMAIMMSFGLPGSICFWLIAPFHPPLTATLLLLAGSLAGSIGAYFVGYRLRHLLPTGPKAQRLTHLLTRRNDLFTQTSLRVLPGFPHVLVNFTSGLLRLPLPTFVFAAILGLTSKWAIYATAVYGARSAIQADESLNLTTLLPLAILGVMLLVSGQLRRDPPPREPKNEL